MKSRKKVLGGVRRAQLITTYGVGSVVAIESESFMIAGIDRWPDLRSGESLIHEPRLQRRLNVEGFRLPPSTENESLGDIPAVRFPHVHSCPGCRRLADIREFGVKRNDPAVCDRCDRDLVPSRFVVCCTQGHIDDFPYFQWIHHERRTKSEAHEMRLQAAGRSASLRDIIISCSCGAHRPMEGALTKLALKGTARCSGRRPWLGNAIETEDCAETPRGMQRGASSVWFSAVRSAIAIPPWSEGIQKIIAKRWKTLGQLTDETLANVVEETGLADEAACSVDDFIRAVEKRRLIEQGLDDESGRDLKTEEYEALIRPTDEQPGRQDFVCVPADEQIDESLAISQVMRVKRLREVRVLEGFTRLGAPGSKGIRTISLYAADARPDWLPAIEVLGEGVFLRFDADRIAAWEAKPAVVERVSFIDASNRRMYGGAGATAPATITPRQMMIHTFAHAVINEWALDCGYPAASMRERLYASDGMTGFMIYTATSDSEGSLGGIVARAESGDLSASIRRAIARAAWCSTDPLCIESPPAGFGNLNHAACHACVLLPETSCEHFNTLLDRALLVGTPEIPSLGFFNATAARSN